MTQSAADLALKTLQLPDNARAAVFAPPSRDFVATLANRAAHVDVYALHHSELNALSRLPENVTLHESVFPAHHPVYDSAVIFIPKGRELLRLLMWRFAHALKPDARLYIAGANNAGAKSAIKDAGILLGHAVTLDYKARQRVGMAIRRNEPPVYPRKWGEMPPDTPQPITFDTPRGAVQLATMPGVFSWQKLDEGTRFLLANITIRNSEAVILDLGCGIGVIGLSLAPTVDTVALLDDNLLALFCAEFGASQNGFTHVRVRASDVYSALDDGEHYDLIVCNPPFHRGIDVTYGVTQRIISEARQHLNPGGRLVIVANAFLPYESLFEVHFTDWHEIARDNRYKIIAGEN